MTIESASAELRALCSAFYLPEMRGYDGGASPEGLRDSVEAVAYRLVTRQRSLANPPSDPVLARELLARMADANRGTGTWEPDWTVVGTPEDAIGGDGDRVVVARDDVLFYASKNEVLVREGSSIVGRVRVPASCLSLAPGFFLAQGNARQARIAERPWLTRLYWHLRPEGAADLVWALTRRLNALELPFRLKVAARPASFERADAVTLYLEPEHVPAAAEAIAATYREVEAALLPQGPMLTLALADGLAVAEGPADGRSFAGHRCRLVAEGLVAALESGGESVEAREASVAERFAAAGLNPGQPHLAPGSTSRFSELTRACRSTPSTRAPAAFEAKLPRAVAAAERLADALCARALWHDGHCNWVGRCVVGGGAAATAPTVAPLEPELYAGAAGVGLFLARLFAQTGVESHRRTAIGALSRDLAMVEHEESALEAISFYGGGLGIAWAARQVAELTDSAELAARAESLLGGVLAHVDGEHRLDVLGGSSGAILCLLNLHRGTRDPVYLSLAGRLGDELLALAERREAGLAWPNARAAGIAAAAPPLTGLGHGAAGIGLALLELSVACGRQDLGDAAREAFAYEDSWFEPERGNWADLRGASAGAGAGMPESSVSTAWCHGAAGIALARLRAMVVDPERAALYEPAARAGLATTVSALAERRADPNADTCLCHGACGLIEVARLGGEVLADPAPVDAAEAALGALVDLHSELQSWPSGAPFRGPHPSLLLGTAGVGYTLLRSQDRKEIPSVLLPGACF